MSSGGTDKVEFGRKGSRSSKQSGPASGTSASVSNSLSARILMLPPSGLVNFKRVLTMSVASYCYSVHVVYFIIYLQQWIIHISSECHSARTNAARCAYVQRKLVPNLYVIIVVHVVIVYRVRVLKMAPPLDHYPSRVFSSISDVEDIGSPRSESDQSNQRKRALSRGLLSSMKRVRSHWKIVILV